MLDPAADSVLSRLLEAVTVLYGDRLASIVLFGSRARGEAQADSDYDVAVFLTEIHDRWDELDRLADLRTRFLDETGVFIDAKPYLVGAYDDRTPLMHEIRQDGLRL